MFIAGNTKALRFDVVFKCTDEFDSSWVIQAGKGGELTHDETTIIAGALQLTEKTATNSMTPIKDVFALDVNDKLNM